ncbi:MAG: hypothetical protein IT574_09600 [Candidatus Aureabacteria bacterium]|nr:hypothetical protein [Candidatus Auribacterota bacterium]NLW94165.1 general secretion pathway protein GspB [Chlamydiota bacterium]HQM53189.1 hypothetical protein [bacterium]
MSIIFEALRKIETEKREGASPALDPPGGQQPPAGRRRLPAPLAVSAAVVFAAAVLFRLLHLVPPPPAEPPPARDAAAPGPMAEVTLEPRSILPAASLPPEPAEPAPPSAAPEAEAHLPALRLRGLSRSGSRSWAIINDRMLKVGDRIEDAEVVEILSDRVKLRRGDTLFTLVY